MPDFLSLPGSSALSPFRLDKLHASLPDYLCHGARFMHYVELTAEATATDRATLQRLLDYGDPAPELTQGEEILVVPRLGTISPWSSKASEIARLCGLQHVARIERGVSYRFSRRDGRAFSADDRRQVAAHIHDRMTESVLDDTDQTQQLFQHLPARPLEEIPLLQAGTSALEQANQAMGLALSTEETAYLAEQYARMGRNPVDVELMMFAQANSEHCRHKIFNASWVIDGQPQADSLFGMIRSTHAQRPQDTIVAYSDNSSVIAGTLAQRFHPDADGRYARHAGLTHILMKVETHNHPTAISPFAGAATGSGGEIRDEGATGVGSKPKAGLCGFSVSNLRIPGFSQPWESLPGRPEGYGRPARIASPLQIMIDGPLGAAAFNNEFGRPNLAGYFRTLEIESDGAMRGYHKPVMLAGGVGNIADNHCFKHTFGDGTLLIQLGGPGMLIGLGGGAASSMHTGSNEEQLDFDSVQRGNPEMQRRAQEVIDRCWQMGEHNPILSIHDVGAGGVSNAFPELIDGAGRGAQLELRNLPLEASGLSPREIWCNEAQERYVLAIAPDDLERFRAICERERCPFAVVGQATQAAHLRVDDRLFGRPAVDIDLAVILGKPPRMTRTTRHHVPELTPLNLDDIGINDAALRVLRMPSVASKAFLIHIGDRSVGGMTARDQMVGPWQVPVADVAVTTLDYDGYAGEAFAVGERTPLALIDPVASGRMAIGEALTNLVAADTGEIGAVRLSANWMAAAGAPGEDAALYDTVRAVALELCPALGISIPVGKDSLSMRTAWRDGAEEKSVTAPLSLIISAFAPVHDARRTLTPQLRTDQGETDLILIDLGRGRSRLGGSALAQAWNQVGDRCPDVDDPGVLKAFYNAIRHASDQGWLLAYHDRSDGGLWATLCEMAFAGHCGVTIEADELCLDCVRAEAGDDELISDSVEVPGECRHQLLRVLFNEELGAVLQVKREHTSALMQAFFSAGLRSELHIIGTINDGGRIHVQHRGETVLDLTRAQLQATWNETSYRIQRLRDNPDCADSEFAASADETDPGRFMQLTFDPEQHIVIGGNRPRIAILREQGVNGHVEMAAAFDRAGFDAIDVHMSDLLSGRVRLDDFRALAACGGFSYGDVLGAGEGWAKSVLFNPRARDQFSAFFARPDSFALGVCNGCQMMSNLGEIIPGSTHWPRFSRNRSEQFEARLVMVEIDDSPSILFAGMSGSQLPVIVSHGEGRADFSRTGDANRVIRAMHFVDHHGQATETYPFNPNGSAQGLTGVTSADGRFTILMPHPERLFRRVQFSWHPDSTGENSAWLRMFRNARTWMDEQ